MKIYNTMSRQKEEFRSIKDREVKIYACGPTVYNYIHIGNARPLCVFDVLRRYLEYRGFNVKFVQNFTDIDDKIIRQANEDHTDYLSIAEKYISEYKKDVTGLNIKEATIYPRATENVFEIINTIRMLIDKDYAYCTDNGDVYFRTKKFKHYGKLSHQPLEDLEVGARISVGEQKEDPMDFALWKGAKPREPFWESPWGQGRPGWHIECSVMVNKYLGRTIDIHCGGQDLIFPHHENEIAQSECCNDGAIFANYWMHNGYINIDNKKMSKSLNNFFTVREIAKQYGYEPIRYLMISSHYRNPINFSIEIIKQCISSLDRLYKFRENLVFIMEHVSSELNVNLKYKELDIKKHLLIYKDKFISAMDDDLNTADALAVLFEFVREVNSNVRSFTTELIKFSLDLFDELSNVLGLLYNKKEKSLETEVEELIEKRQFARKNKDWVAADKIRDELKSKNIILEDTPQGVRWSFKNNITKI